MAGRASCCMRLHEGKGRLHEGKGGLHKGKGKGGQERAIEQGKNGTGCMRARAGCTRVVEQGKNGTGCARVRAGSMRARAAAQVQGQLGKGSWAREWDWLLVFQSPVSETGHNQGLNQTITGCNRTISHGYSIQNVHQLSV